MDKYISLHNRNIRVRINLYAIRIFNDDGEVTALLKTNAKAFTRELISSIKSEYFKLFNKTFTVSDASMAVEIWAHVYVEKFAKAISILLPVKLVSKIAGKIIFHCQEIDIGEKGHDNNRFIWDLLSPLKTIIGALLFYRQRK